MSPHVPLVDLSRHETDVVAAVASGINRVRDSGCFMLGEELASFETEFAAWCGAPYCIGVANGTDALELALRALNCGPGDEVATVANAGMYATVAILAVGATPRYVDIDGDTMTMSAHSLRSSVSPITKAVILTHLYGGLADMEGLAAAAGGVAIIEDCAQAHGAARAGRKAGTYGTIGCFSFYPTKNLGAMGDAGALITADPDLAAALRALRTYGWGKRFVAERPGGRNSRLDEMQAAILRAKLPFLDGWNARRREIAAIYDRNLSDLSLILPKSAAEDHVFHLYVVRTPSRDELAVRLGEAAIGSDVHYPLPDYRQPALTDRMAPVSPLAETEKASAEVLSLPCHAWMTDKEVEYVVAAVREALLRLGV